MSLLVICEILGHFVNSLTAGDKYTLRNNENLLQPIQMILSRKEKTFSEFFPPQMKFYIKILNFLKKMTLIAYISPNLQTAKDLVRRMSKKPPFRTPFDSQHLKGPQAHVKSAWQHFYQISPSLWSKLTLENVSLSDMWDPKSLCQ